MRYVVHVYTVPVHGPVQSPQSSPPPTYIRDPAFTFPARHLAQAARDPVACSQDVALTKSVADLGRFLGFHGTPPPLGWIYYYKESIDDGLNGTGQ